jgi:excisionase family DNA binding protein
VQLTLDDRDLERLAARVAELLRDDLRKDAARPERWLDTTQAAEHLGISRHALRHLIARRAVPFTQEREGARIYFRASELDEWRAQHAVEIRPSAASPLPEPRCASL